MYLEFLKAKNEYIAASRRAFACGLAAGSGGNLSIRIPGTQLMIVKPSGITLGEVDETNLVIADLFGNLVEGKTKPTKETLLHGGLYRNRPQIGAVVHVHPVYSIMCANCFEEMPLVTKQMKQITSRPVPILKIKHNTVDEAGMRQVEALLKDRPEACCFLLEEHGLVSFAATMQDAQNNAELIEENARVFWEMAKAVRTSGSGQGESW